MFFYNKFLQQKYVSEVGYFTSIIISIAFVFREIENWEIEQTSNNWFLFQLPCSDYFTSFWILHQNFHQIILCLKIVLILLKNLKKQCLLNFSNSQSQLKTLRFGGDKFEVTLLILLFRSREIMTIWGCMMEIVQMQTCWQNWLVMKFQPTLQVVEETKCMWCSHQILGGLNQVIMQ